METRTYRLTWQGIKIEARYKPEDYGGVITHLEIESIDPPKARLPVTETGYRSHFHPIGTIEADYDGDVVKAVTDWLDREAQPKEWKKYVEESRQMELF